MISKRFRDVGLNFETRLGLIYLEEARRYRLSGQPEAVSVWLNRIISTQIGWFKQTKLG